MAHKKKAGTAGRYGPRYGRKIRYKVRTVEKAQRGKQECPNCGKHKIKRLAQGIFECRGCGAKITGNAYTIK
ncbi:50S ribosomal protein L37ae [archaeon]|nr:50S ribosomal protein L37ae [archaeon]